MVEATVRNTVGQAISVLLLCALIELSAGSVLGGMEEGFERLPGLVVMVPPLLALRGNISGALASRLGTALHGGVIEPRFLMNPELRVNVLSSIFLTFLVSLSVGVLAFLVSVLVGVEHMVIWSFILIALISGLLSNFIIVALTVSIAIGAFIHGWDPDNITSPIVATIGDFLTVLCIFIAVLLVGV